MRKFWLKLLVSVLLGGLFVWLAVRDIEWEDTKTALSQLSLGRVIFYFLILSVIHLIRVVRWGTLIRPIGKISFARLFSVGSVGIMALMLFPFRLGEFARPLLLAERGKIRFSAAFATIVLERVIDSVAMASLLVGVLFFIDTDRSKDLNIRFWSYLILAFFLVIMLFMVLAYRYRQGTIGFCKKVLRRIPEKVSKRALSFISSFIDGLDILPNFRLLSEFLFLTVLYWFLNGLGMWYMFSAFSGLADLGWLEAFTVLSILCVGLMIPGGPGMVGNFHYSVKVGLSLFLSNLLLGSQGVAYAFVVHAIQVSQQLLFGLPFLFTGHVSLTKMVSLPGRIEAVEPITGSQIEGTCTGQGQKTLEKVEVKQLDH